MTTEVEHQDQGSKVATICVNGRARDVSAKELTFEDLVELAHGPNPPRGQYIVYTITYRKAKHDDREEDLLPGQSVKLKDGMVFDVVLTDRS